MRANADTLASFFSGPQPRSRGCFMKFISCCATLFFLSFADKNAAGTGIKTPLLVDNMEQAENGVCASALKMNTTFIKFCLRYIPEDSQKILTPYYETISILLRSNANVSILQTFFRTVFGNYESIVLTATVLKLYNRRRDHRHYISVAEVIDMSLTELQNLPEKLLQTLRLCQETFAKLQVDEARKIHYEFSSFTAIALTGFHQDYIRMKLTACGVVYDSGAFQSAANVDSQLAQMDILKTPGHEALKSAVLRNIDKDFLLVKSLLPTIYLLIRAPYALESMQKLFRKNLIEISSEEVQAMINAYRSANITSSDISMSVQELLNLDKQARSFISAKLMWAVTKMQHIFVKIPSQLCGAFLASPAVHMGESLKDPTNSLIYKMLTNMALPSEDIAKMLD